MKDLKTIRYVSDSVTVMPGSNSVSLSYHRSSQELYQMIQSKLRLFPLGWYFTVSSWTWPMPIVGECYMLIYFSRSIIKNW